MTSSITPSDLKQVRCGKVPERIDPERPLQPLILNCYNGHTLKPDPPLWNFGAIFPISSFNWKSTFYLYLIRRVWACPLRRLAKMGVPSVSGCYSASDTFLDDRIDAIRQRTCQGRAFAWWPVFFRRRTVYKLLTPEVRRKGAQKIIFGEKRPLVDWLTDCFGYCSLTKLEKNDDNLLFASLHHTRRQSLCILCIILLLARYVPNVAMRSRDDICIIMYTVSQKTGHQTIVHIFTKYWPIF